MADRARLTYGSQEPQVRHASTEVLHRFNSREAPVCRLVQQAWRHRILVTVTVHSDHRERPVEIILHGAPPPFGD
jgi:hypothetical protein